MFLHNCMSASMRTVSKPDVSFQILAKITPPWGRRPRKTQSDSSRISQQNIQGKVHKIFQRGIAKTETTNTKTQLKVKACRCSRTYIKYVYYSNTFLGIAQGTQKSLRITYRYYRLQTSSGAASLPAASWHRVTKHAKQTSVLSISHTNKIKIKLRRLQVHTY